MYYLIKESLSPCAPKDLTKGGAQYVAVLTTEEWQQRRDCFDMLIDMDMETVPPSWSRPSPARRSGSCPGWSASCTTCWRPPSDRTLPCWKSRSIG